MRTEKDALGEKTIPDEAHYGIHTARSLENFTISGEPVPREIVLGIVRIKAACAKANAALDLLAPEKRDAILEACRRVLAGECADQFPIDMYQAGSGTSTNMNVNEVLANLANETLGGRKGDRALVHPHDDVNKGQSTNSVFPSAVRMAACGGVVRLLVALRGLAEALRERARAFAGVYKAARTHLQDAVPILLGQEFAAYARALEKDLRRLEQVRARLRELSVGGNAVGTGVNTKNTFRAMIIRELGTLEGEVYECAADGVEATQFLTDLADLSGALRLLSLDLQKICNDLRLLSSGPNTGLGELVLPAVEPGSSIMPGKVNPSICEAVNMVCLQVQGYDHAVAAACGAGQLELNTHMPLVGANLIKGLHILERACVLLREKCVAGITAREDVCRRHFETSAGLATVLTPRLGYDGAAELVREALRTGRSLHEVVRERRLMSDEEFDRLLRSSTGPNL